MLSYYFATQHILRAVAGPRLAHSYLFVQKIISFGRLTHKSYCSRHSGTLPTPGPVLSCPDDGDGDGVVSVTPSLRRVVPRLPVGIVDK